LKELLKIELHALGHGVLHGGHQVLADAVHDAHHQLHLARGEDGAEGGTDLLPLVPLHRDHDVAPDAVGVGGALEEVNDAVAVDKVVKIAHKDVLDDLGVANHGDGRRVGTVRPVDLGGNSTNRACFSANTVKSKLRINVA
jgi:hypothetical protein